MPLAPTLHPWKWTWQNSTWARPVTSAGRGFTCSEGLGGAAAAQLGSFWVGWGAARSQGSEGARRWQHAAGRGWAGRQGPGVCAFQERQAPGHGNGQVGRCHARPGLRCCVAPGRHGERSEELLSPLRSGHGGAGEGREHGGGSREEWGRGALKKQGSHEGRGQATWPPAWCRGQGEGDSRSRRGVCVAKWKCQEGSWKWYRLGAQSTRSQGTTRPRGCLQPSLQTTRSGEGRARAQASAVRGSLRKGSVEGRGPGTGAPRPAELCGTESEWQNREVAFGSTEVTRGAGCGWWVGRRADRTGEAGRLSSLRPAEPRAWRGAGQLKCVQPAPRVVCPHIPLSHLATCSTEGSHALLFGGLFKFSVVLLSDYLSVW